MLTTNEKIVLNHLIALYHQDAPLHMERCDNIDGITNNDLTLIFKSLHQKGYIELKTDITGDFRISLTHSGLSYQEIETLSKKASIVNNFNAPITNSAIGTTGNVNININTSYDEARSIIASRNMEPSDKEIALKLIDYIEILTENNAPLNKGFLAKFSDIISKHSWLLTLTGNALIKYFIGQ
ncbi:hypothetical protein [Frisingicoccus sp.]|uniref:hypothetical protein n=1 Tax=Frisingicoccus sp. TaxID=1918627 RepID=UPI003AB367D2